MKLLFIIMVTLAGGKEASQVPAAPEDPGKTAEQVSSEVSELIQQHARLLEQVEQMRMQIEHLARATRESRAAPIVLDDLDSLLAALSSESYQERADAATALRRGLVDRMWLLLETPDLSPEAIHRLKSILVETSAMIRLTGVAVDLQPADRDALWNLLDAEPQWVLAALGDDPDQIRAVLQWPPPGHERAAEIVIAALIRDEMRPVPQTVALSQIEDPSSPLLREALRSLLLPRGQPPSSARNILGSQRQQAAERAVRILARRPTPDLVGFFLAYLKSAPQWSARVEFVIVESLVRMGATEAAVELLAIAREKRERLRGGYGLQDVFMKPGDCELVAAALLLGMDLEALRIKRKDAQREDDPTYYGFAAIVQEEHPDREAAFLAVEQAIEEVGPFAPVDGYEEALERLTDR